MSETKVCVRCHESRPLAAFTTNRAGANRRSTCRRCNKTAHRRAKGILPKVRKHEPVFTKDKALRQVRALLGKLLAHKAEATGVKASTVQYQARYRCDAQFREREIVRTWTRKAASGVGRTDGRTSVPMHTDGTLTPSVVAGLFASAHECAYCHERMTPRDKTLDHVMPVSRGGAHSISNVAIACRSCNSRKRTRTPAEWMASAITGTNSGALRPTA